jgi:hypothetical protein
VAVDRERAIGVEEVLLGGGAVAVDRGEAASDALLTGEDRARRRLARHQRLLEGVLRRQRVRQKRRPPRPVRDVGLVARGLGPQPVGERVHRRARLARPVRDTGRTDGPL